VSTSGSRLLRVEGAFERLRFLEKIYGGKAFDNVGGIVAQNDRMEELFRDLEMKGIIEPRKKSAQEERSLARLRAEPVYPAATVMTITIVYAWKRNHFFSPQLAHSMAHSIAQFSACHAYMYGSHPP
jgi:hypothetical protein